MEKFIGIDLGTSSVKILITNLNGEILFCDSKNYGIESPLPLYSEQHPAIWYDACLAVLRNAFKVIDSKTIKAISFAGQMHGLVILDKFDQVIRPCILWNDGRSYKESEYLNNNLKELLKEEKGMGVVEVILIVVVLVSLLLRAILHHHGQMCIYRRICIGRPFRSFCTLRFYSSSRFSVVELKGSSFEGFLLVELACSE